MTSEEEHKEKRRWEVRARHCKHKPNPVFRDRVPKLIRSLGSCLFPLPRGRKAWNWPHHLDEYRFKASDEIFNAYLESGSGFGIACAGDLIVVDIDEKTYASYIANKLPASAWQITGSREGYHIFYRCGEQEKRINLRIPYPKNHLIAEGHADNILYTSGPHSGYKHIGEVKADEHGYVVGPGSVHPSGNKYGPLRGDDIAEISKEELEDALSMFIHKNEQSDFRKNLKQEKRKRYNESNSSTRYEFFELDADDVVPWLEPENRVPHPGHGSDSGKNFMKNSDRDTFTCWRHDYGGGVGCGLNARQLLAQIESGRECDYVRSSWPIIEDDEVYGDASLLWYSWRRAVRDELISYKEIPYKVAKAYAVHRGYLDETSKLAGDAYWDTINAIRCEMEEPHLPKEKPEEEA